VTFGRPPNVSKARDLIVRDLRRDADGERDAGGTASGEALMLASDGAAAVERARLPPALARAQIGLPLDESAGMGQRSST